MALSAKPILPQKVSQNNPISREINQTVNHVRGSTYR